MMFETFGIAGTSGVTAGVILSLSPIPNVVFSSVMLGEKTTLMQKLFLILGIVGVIYIAVNVIKKRCMKRKFHAPLGRS